MRWHDRLAPPARELSNCSPPIFDFRHHFWLCIRHHPRVDRDKHPPPIKFRIKRHSAHSPTRSIRRFLKSPASVTDTEVSADVWQNIKWSGMNAMQGVYFVIGYEKEPSRRVHSISVHFICEARVRHFRVGDPDR